jgi:hypothetical protein
MLKSLKLEYETTNISQADLLAKYKYTADQIPFHEWVKEDKFLDNKIVEPKATQSELVTGVFVPDIIAEQNSSLPAEQKEEETEEQKEATKIRNSINKTANSLITQANSILISGLDDLSAKDVKDLASALISLKEATLGKDPTVVVNLQNNTSIQNNLLMQIVDTIKTTPRDC